jgi:hypothetical protein
MVVARPCLCPGRGVSRTPVVSCRGGDGDAQYCSLVMIVGAGISHNFSPGQFHTGDRRSRYGAVITGLLVCLFIGFTMRKKKRRED